MIRRRVVVHGRVHGVFFRATSADLARTVGVTGCVRNEPDGTVHAEFEGDDNAVHAMVAWCHQGPARAVVTGVDVFDDEPVGDTTFQAV